MTRIGADVDQLDALAQVLDGRSTNLTTSDRTISAALAQVTWHGPDADAFRATWAHQHSPALRRVARVLHELATGVDRQSEAQRAASANAVSTPPAVVGPPPRVPADLDGDGTVDDLEQEWYDRHESGEEIGPPQLHLDEDGLVPQGLGHDPTRDEILTSYNNSDGVRLSIQEQETGVEVGDVRLGALPDGDGEAGDPPNKGGGVATDGEYVWLADGNGVYVYRRSDIDAAAPGATVPAIDFVDTPASSWVTYHDGKVYVGDFKNPDYLFSYEGDPKMYRYDVDPDTGGLTNPTDGQDIPYSVQGATVTDDGIVFSRSFSDKPVVSPHDLTFQEFEGSLEDFNLEPADEASKVYDLPHFSEGIVQVDDDIWVLSEGGADKFDGKGEKWIQIVPFEDLDDLDGDGGTGPHVELPDLPGFDIPDVPSFDLPGLPAFPGIPTPDVPSIPGPDLPIPLPDDLPPFISGIPDLPGDIKDGLGDVKDGVEDFGGDVKDGLGDVGGGIKDGISGGLGKLGL